MTPASEVDVGALDAGFSSAKRQILLSLKRQGSVSLTDLSQELRISKMATLKHLTALEDKGLTASLRTAHGSRRRSGRSGVPPLGRRGSGRSRGRPSSRPADCATGRGPRGPYGAAGGTVRARRRYTPARG